jgi:spore germination protein GerM
VRRVLAAAALATALAGAACGGARERAPVEPAGEATAPAPGAADEGREAAPSDLLPVALESVRVYFPSQEGDLLRGEDRQVYKTPHPGDRAKQIVAALLEGPEQGGSSRALPEGTRLRQLFVLEDGTAWADFSSEIRENLAGGSANELMAVYAVVDSIAFNVPEIARVGFLVEGRPVETLNGHLDLRRALRGRRDLLAVAAPAAE